jgi:hypothetical protein
MAKLFPFSEKNLSLKNGHVSAEFEFVHGGGLSLTYEWDASWPLKGITKEATGAESPLRRAHDLWRSTCFEAFLKPRDSSKYWEINLSPRCEWNAYAFTDYRTPTPPQETVMFHLEKMEIEPGGLRALLKLNDLQMNFQIGLCCVLETSAGEKSFWALKHPAAKPDFHDAAGFILSGTSGGHGENAK